MGNCDWCNLSEEEKQFQLTKDIYELFSSLIVRLPV